MRGGKGGKAWATCKVVVNRVCHGYHGYHGYGYGSGFWHTVAHCVPIPRYHKYAWVNYNKVRINLIVLKLVFKNIFSVNSRCHTMTEPNMVVSAVHISLLLTIILSLPLPSSLKNNVSPSSTYQKLMDSAVLA